MGITKAIARDIPVNGVNFVEYYYRTTTEGVEVPTTVHHVAVKVNKNVFVGEYSANSEANAFSLAQDVVKGLLIKNGCTRPDTRITGIKFKKYNFPSPNPIAGGTVPNAVNWSNVSYNGILGVFTYSQRQITGTNQNIVLNLSLTDNNIPSMDTIAVYIGASSLNGGNSDWSTTSDPYSYGMIDYGHNSNLTVVPNSFIVFGGFSGNFTVTVKNTSDNNTVLDTFTFSSFGLE